MDDAIDPEVWGSLAALEAAGEPGFLAALLREFLAAAPRRMQALQAACARGDAVAVEWEAHGLKGSCGTLGALRMVRLCEQLEQAAHAGAKHGYAEAVGALEAEWRVVREALAARLENQPGEPAS